MINIFSDKEAIFIQRVKDTDTVRSKFRDSVLPIYGINDETNGRLKFVGTCTLIEVEEKKILLTSAHIIDDSMYPLYITGDNNRFVQIEPGSEFFSTLAPDGIRDSDLYDFAWQVLSDDVLENLKDATFITSLDYCERNDVDQTGRVLVALGYPSSKNKKIKSLNSVIKPKIFAYSSTRKVDQELNEQIGLNGHDHIMLDHHKFYAQDSDGHQVNSYSPKGMSGGVLIDVGNLSSAADQDLNKGALGIVIGLLMQQEAYDNVVLATKFRVIIQAIRSKF